MRGLLLLLPLLASCASYRATHDRLWREHGACAVVCDVRQGHLSTGYATTPWSCRCNTPQLATYNAYHEIPMGSPRRDIYCCGGCVEEARAILKRDPWRAPKDAPPFEDPLGDMLREIRDAQ